MGEAAKTVLFEIERRNSTNEESYWEKFELPYRANMNVISALMEIRRNPVNMEGKKNHSSNMGYELPGRSVWRMFNGHQRQSTPVVYSSS
jgi:hypothetical protein